MGLRSSSVSGRGFLGMGVTYSLTHCQGYFPEIFRLLKMLAAGCDIHGENSFFNLGRILLGTVDFFAFLFSIFMNTCSGCSKGMSFTLMEFSVW